MRNQLTNLTDLARAIDPKAVSCKSTSPLHDWIMSSCYGVLQRVAPDVRLAKYGKRDYQNYTRSTFSLSLWTPRGGPSEDSLPFKVRFAEPRMPDMKVWCDLSERVRSALDGYEGVCAGEEVVCYFVPQKSDIKTFLDTATGRIRDYALVLSFRADLWGPSQDEGEYREDEESEEGDGRPIGADMVSYAEPEEAVSGDFEEDPRLEAIYDLSFTGLPRPTARYRRKRKPERTSTSFSEGGE